MRQRKRIPKVLLRIGLLAALLLTLVPFEVQSVSVTQAQTAPQTTTTLHLRVESARTEPRWPGSPNGVVKGAVITNYKFIINEDNVGDTKQARTAGCSPTDSTYPANCNWPSTQAMPSSSPIVTQGDQSLLNGTTGINLPVGKYIISVMADNYRLDGVHFTIPLANPGLVTVGMHPYPLPLATVSIQVFNDNNSVNSQFDVPGEQGLPGFRGHIYDVLNEVTTDWFGNPLCTQYEKDSNGHTILDANLRPVNITKLGGKCLSDANGIITIPNVGPNRYTATVVPPDGTNWVQTTTLEGNHDFDAWVQEGDTGFDNEFVGPNAEPVPMIPFGFVQPTVLPTSSATGEIKGKVVAAKIYIPQTAGLNFNGDGGGNGVKIDKPISRPWVALTDLLRGDITVYVGQGNPDGTFDIKNVPDGDYSISYWDGPQNHIFESRNVTVSKGAVADLGVLMVAGWWTGFSGKVCIDKNSNGKCDPGEPGLPKQSVLLKTRGNSVMDRGTALVQTDLNGNYLIEGAYPLTSWVVMEVFNQRFQTTGVTYQADNDPTEHTVLGGGVDISVLPVIGLSGRVDWAVKPYASGTNGGIVGTVTYDTTRNELNARFSATEDYQPGIPGLWVNLYATVKDAKGNFVLNADGSYKKGPRLNRYLSETWERPKNCTARDVNGKPLTSQKVLPPSTGNHDCLEAPLMGMQFQNDFSTVTGNYTLATITADPITGAAIPEMPVPAGDYLVEVDIPNDSFGRPLYKVTKEEDVNIFNGDQFTTDEPPPPCAGPLHTVHVTNPAFLAGGGSPFEGQQMPLCNTKMVTVKVGRSIAPNFNLFTDVPVPGRLFGWVVDDLNVSTDPTALMFGEKAGVPNVPIGIYDYTNRLVHTIQSDPQGFFEVLMPSTSSYNCPLPAGPCPSVYRFLGNDPGQPGQVNPNYNPQYRSIAASFEVWPGLDIPADLAPTPIATGIFPPGGQTNKLAQCKLDTATPQLFAISKPYVTSQELAESPNQRVAFSLYGQGFGATRGRGRVSIDNSDPDGVVVTAWSNTQIDFYIADGAMGGGVHQLDIIAGNGQRTVNGLSFHYVGDDTYNPTVYEAGPGKTYATIQSALEAASNTAQALVVVYPGATATFNPHGVYYENVIMHSPIQLQGVGPGGVRDNGSWVPGSIIDGLGFTNETYGDNWRTLLNTIRWDGNQNVGEGAVVTVLARSGQFATSSTNNFKATIDGFTIQGGVQQTTPTGTPTVPGGVVITQGGGIFVNANASNLQITNNMVKSNGGSYGGGIRVGTPYTLGNNNDNIRIAQNRIVANGGSNLAGGVAIFAGTTGYEIAQNDICGNYSAEYGGGISHFGLSAGSIHDNRIYFNTSYDEGGGVMIAGELPANPATTLSLGAGPVDIYNNTIQANLADDDGGGIRFLMSGLSVYKVYNNMIVNNISAHEGGGIAIDDAPNVRIYNNTIMKNITTATAATSNGQPAPAGISTGANSLLLQKLLTALNRNAPKFSNPVLFNNILWDNRAGNYVAGGVSGIGLAGDPNPIRHWDVGAADGSGLLSPTNSILQVDGPPGTVPPGTVPATTTTGAANRINPPSGPGVVATFDVSVAIFPWRNNPNFVGAGIVAVDLPPNLMGDYHLAAGSAAINRGASAKGSVDAPSMDIDGQERPNSDANPIDIGADEYFPQR